MIIKKEQLQSLEINNNKLTIKYCGNNDRSAISTITLKIEVKDSKVSEQMLCM